MVQKIVNVSPYNYILGGSDSYFVAFNQLMKKNGVNVAPFCVRDDQNTESPWNKYFVSGIDLNKRNMANALKFVYSKEAKDNIEELISDFEPDVIHLHIYYGHFTSSILATIKKKFNLPIVQTVHDYKLVCPVYSLCREGKICEDCEGHKFWKAIPRRCNQGSMLRTGLSVIESYTSRVLGNISSIDRFIAVCDFQASRLVALGVPKEKLRTIHNFVDCNEFEPRVSPPSKARFMYFGRIENSKGVFDILNAAKELPQYDFVFAGNGSALVELTNKIKADDINNITMAGHVNGRALHDLVRSCTATILVPTVYENCPMSVLESLAMAVPVIGSNMGGIPELIEHNVCGFITPPSDRFKLIEYLRALGDNNSLAKEFGDNGRRLVEKKFSADVHFKALEEVYRELGVDL